MPQGGVPNAGPSLGTQAIHATVPGAYYADQGYRLWDEGRYGWSIASHAASFVEAGLGVFTLGTSTRYLAAQRAASAAIRSVPNSAASQLARNKAAGDAFEQQVMQQLQNTQSGVVQQVTVRTQSGVRTRIDLLGRDSSGRIVCTECKSSATAPLTTNQAAAFPEIQRTGGVVVGRGKPGFPGGTEIPPTTVDIVRP